METTKRKRLQDMSATRIPSVPVHLQNYILSILYIIFLPVLPLMLEWYLTGVVSQSSLTLLASIFSISIGATSGSRLLFGLSIFISIIFAATFGVIVGNQIPFAPSSPATQSIVHDFRLPAGISIFFISVVHAAERWNLHVVDHKDFWQF